MSLPTLTNRAKKRTFVRASVLLFVLTLFFALSPLGVHLAHAADFWDWLGDVGLEAFDKSFGYVIRGAAWLLFSIAAGIASASAEFLDLAIQFSLDSSKLKLDALTTGWEIIRDLANMVFIFILVYIAFATILQLSNFNTKRVLAILIIVALLINFSFFLTGIVIDVSNILGAYLYDAMTGGGRNLGEVFIEGLKLSTLQKEGVLEGLSNMQKATVHTLGSIFLLVAAFVFLAGAFIFIIRTVVLIFVLTLSPAAFAAAILPKTRGYWNMWLEKLINNAFVAPIFLLLVLVVVAIINSGDLFQETTTLMTSEGQNQVAAGDQSLNQAFLLQDENYLFSETSGIVLNYVLLIGLLIASVTVARRLADDVGNLSVKWAGRVTGLAAGAVGLTYRQTAGRGFRSFRDSKAVTRMLESENRFVRRMGQLTRQTADYGAKARGDVRAGVVGKTVGATAGAALKAGDIDVRTGRPPREGGFAAQHARQVRARAQRAEAEQEQVARSIRQRAEQRGQRIGQTEKEIDDIVKKQMAEYRKQQAKDLESGGVIRMVIPRVTFTMAANKQAADVIRGTRKAPQAPAAPFSTEQTRQMQDAMRRATEGGA